MHNETIERLLTQPDNLKMALDLEPYIVNTKKVIFDHYWKHVREILDDRLKEQSTEGRWITKLSSSIHDSRSYMCIYDKTSPRGEETKFNNYTFTFECLTGNPEPCYYGIPRISDVQSPDELELISGKLRKYDMKPVNAWIGYAYLHNRGLPTIDARENNTVLSLNDGNLDVNHTLARGAAMLLWDLFDKFRPDVERLNDKLASRMTNPQ